MKSHRKSRSTENRNAHKEMLARGGDPLAATLPPMPVRPDRRWRRANRHVVVGTTQLNAHVLNPNETVHRPTITIITDKFTGAVLAYDLS